MPEESKWPEPALFFLYKGEEQAIGIESKASFKKLAQAIHDAGVLVRLDGWQPNQESELTKAFTWQADPQQVAAKARMETLPPGTASLMTPQGMVLAIIRQCWALGLWLVLTGAAVYYGYQNWNNLVVRFAADDGQEPDQEFGFRNAERDYGEWNDVKRDEGGIRVYEALICYLRTAEMWQ